MPAANYPDQIQLHGQLTHSSTEKRRIQKNIDNANVRVVAEAKLSDRKKVSFTLLVHLFYRLFDSNKMMVCLRSFYLTNCVFLL